MGILKKRPLLAAALVLISFCVLGTVLPIVAVAVIIGVLFLLCVCFGVLHAVRRSGRCRFLLLLLSLAAFLGAGRICFDRFYQKYTAEPLYHTEIEGTLCIDEIVYRSSYGSKYYVTLQSANGEAHSIKAAFTTDVLSPFYLGDRVGGRFYCVPVSDETQSAEDLAYSRANGVSLVLMPATDSVPVLTESGTDSLRAQLNDFRYRLYGDISEAVGGEAGGLVGALLLGVRDELDVKTVRDFRRTGLSHLLALSGLHLAIIMALVERFIRFLGMGRKMRCMALVFICGAYLVLTGGSFSMLRATLMLLTVQLSRIFGGDYDGLTSLGLGGALIVLLTPNAVFDVSFQLTMLATLGILSFGSLQAWLRRLIPQKEGILRPLTALLRGVLTSVCISLAAMLPILPIQWLVFGEFSLLTPLSNLLMIPLATPLLAIGVVILLLALVGLPFVPLAWLVSWPARAILWIVQQLSPARSVLSLERGFVPYIIVPLCVLTAALLLIPLKKRWRPLVLAPFAMSVIAFAVCYGVSNAMGADEVRVIYQTTGSNEVLVLEQNDRAVLCDLSSGGVTRLKEGMEYAGVGELEVLMLTHYHRAHVAALGKFCRSYLVRELWLPAPLSDDDARILSDIERIALEENIVVTIYQSNSAQEVFGGTLRVSSVLRASRSVEPAFYIDVDCCGTRLRYQSAAYSEYARNAGLEIAGGDHTHLILGGHGPRPHDTVSAEGSAALREVWVASEAVLEWCVLPSGVHCTVCPGVLELLSE